jgi:glycosyltransferase involved in cell wall biosynthesis
MVGPFGLRRKGTMAVRALPMARALAGRGHSVTLLLPAWDSPEDAGKRWEAAGVSVENSPPLSRLPLYGHLFLTAWLVRRALALHPDVVHCFKPKAHAGLAAFCFWWLARLGLSKARLVLDSDDWEGAGGWNELERYSPLQKRLFAWQERWGLTHADALTLASRALQTIAWSLGVAPDATFYVPNGVSENPAVLHPSPREAKRALGLEGCPVVLLYSRFFEFRLERIAQIWRGVSARLPAARLLVVGKGLFGEEERLAALLREAGCSEGAVFAGWVEESRLPDFFRAADLAIYPYDDTLVNRAKCAAKLIDLLAAGLAVVADAVGQNGEYIEHGSSGWLVAPGDDEGFAGAVASLLEDEALHGRLGAEARRRVTELFSWARLAEVVERAYKKG